MLFSPFLSVLCFLFFVVCFLLAVAAMDVPAPGCIVSMPAASRVSPMVDVAAAAPASKWSYGSACLHARLQQRPTSLDRLYRMLARFHPFVLIRPAARTVDLLRGHEGVRSRTGAAWRGVPPPCYSCRCVLDRLIRMTTLPNCVLRALAAFGDACMIP